MATSFTLHDDRFPSGQSVAVYLASPYGGFAPTGVPGGSLITSASVGAGGTVSFTGLTEGTTYYAYAQVSAVNIYVKFTTSPLVGSGVGACVYTGGAYPVRPSGFTSVEFVGPTDPGGLAQANDTWIKTA